MVYQVFGNLGALRTAWASAAWLMRLLGGRIERHSQVPEPKFRMVATPKVDAGLVHYGYLRSPEPTASAVGFGASLPIVEPASEA